MVFFQPSLGRRELKRLAGLLRVSRLGRQALLTFAGPALVASVAYLDPGNFATNIAAGGRYGYRLLWVVVAANLAAMLFQTGARSSNGPMKLSFMNSTCSLAVSAS